MTAPPDFQAEARRIVSMHLIGSTAVSEIAAALAAAYQQGLEAQAVGHTFTSDSTGRFCTVCGGTHPSTAPES